MCCHSTTQQMQTSTIIRLILILKNLASTIAAGWNAKTLLTQIYPNLQCQCINNCIRNNTISGSLFVISSLLAFYSLFLLITKREKVQNKLCIVTVCRSAIFFAIIPLYRMVCNYADDCVYCSAPFAHDTHSVQWFIFYVSMITFAVEMCAEALAWVLKKCFGSGGNDNNIKQL